MLRPHRLIGLLALTFLTPAAPAAAAQEQAASRPQVNAPIETIGLFKNGLAVVRRSVTLPADGGRTFDITDLPEPVHGTFWVESTADVTLTVTHAEVAVDEEDAAPQPGMSNQALAGATVSIYFKQEHLPKVRGVVAAPPSEEKSWDRSYGWTRPRQTHWWSGNWSSGNVYMPQQTAQPLVIESDRGEVLIDPQSVAYLHVESRPSERTERRPVLRAVLAENADEDVELGILYLTKGASWAPSYSSDITNSQRLALRQKAVVRNELEDLDDAEILLISGFPNIEFGHVLSPMSPATNLAGFFRALGTENRLSHASRGDVMSQAVMGNAAAPGGGDPMTIDAPSLTGDDLHYHSIGRHTLALGDTLMINTARGSAAYERIVKWKQQDDRDEWGRRQHGSRGAGSELADPWDALRFDNPLDRPMTTAPATIMKDGLVRGQSMLYWTSPGEQNTLRVNKALSVRVFAGEVEIDDQRQGVSKYGTTYRQSTVEGTLQATNRRAQPITLIAVVEFSGDLVEAEGKPKVEARAEGVWSLNARQQLTWTLELAPGETRELDYSYHVLGAR